MTSCLVLFAAFDTRQTRNGSIFEELLTNKSLRLQGSKYSWSDTNYASEGRGPSQAQNICIRPVVEYPPFVVDRDAAASRYSDIQPIGKSIKRLISERIVTMFECVVSDEGSETLHQPNFTFDDESVRVIAVAGTTPASSSRIAYSK